MKNNIYALIIFVAFIGCGIWYSLNYVSLKEYERTYEYSETPTFPALPLGDEDAPIDINTANEEILSEIPGVGEKTAALIIKYREENGNFTDINQLDNIEGINKKQLQTIKHYITIQGMD